MNAIKNLLLLISVYACPGALFCVCEAQSQGFDFDESFFPTPNACDLGKYGIVPVSYYTGTASVSIPLWTMTRGNVGLDISLSYDGSGILMNTLPGWVGQSWSLLAGGVISREIRVKPDEYIEPVHITERFEVGREAFFGANLPYLGYFQVYDHLNAEDSYWDEERNGWVDTYLSDFCADIFHFNFMGLSGTFFLGEDGEWKVDCEQNIDVVFNINDTSNYISPFIDKYPDSQSYYQPKVIKGFTLIDENGTQYLFGNSEVVNSADAIEYSLPFSACRGNEYYSPWSATSWYLTEIKDRLGNILYELQYERGYFATQCMATDYWVNNRFLSFGHNIPSASQMSWPPFCLSITSPVYLMQITCIGLDNEVNNSVCFEWDDAFSTDSTAYGSMYSSLGGASAMFNTSSTYGNNTLGCFAPQLVQNADGESASLFSPYYYLQDSRYSIYQFPITNRRMVNFDTYDPLQATGLKYLKRLIIGDKGEMNRQTITLSYNTIGPRMHLEEINIKAKNVEAPQRYKFAYNNWDNIEREDYSTCNTDHWGYYKRISGPINTLEDFENARSVAFSTSADGMLSSIIYPTGGCTDFKYQQNYYEKYLSDNYCNFVESQSYTGGYRIHEIITYQDETRTKKLDQKTYDYSGGILTTKPRYCYSYITRYGFVEECLIRPTIPMKTKWRPHIGYSEVKETNMDGSYIIRRYRNLQPQDLVRVCALPLLNQLPEGVDLASVDGLSQFDEIEDKSYYCGKLICEQIFDKSQIKVQESTYEYRYLNPEELISNSSIIESLANYKIYSHYYGNTYHDIDLEGRFPLRRYYPKINQTRCIERTMYNNQLKEEVTIDFYEYKTMDLCTGGYNHKADISKCICSAHTTDLDRSDPLYYWPIGVPLDALSSMENTISTEYEYLESDYSRSSFFLPLTKESLRIDSIVSSEKEYVYNVNGLLDKEIIRPNAMDAKTTREYLSYDRGLPTSVRIDGTQNKYMLWNSNGNIAAVVTGRNVSCQDILIDPSFPDPKEQLRISGNSAFEPARDQSAVYAQYNDLNQMSSMTVGRGQTTYYEYDDFGRLTIVRDLHKNKVFEYSYGGDGENWIRKKMYLDEDSTRCSISIQYYDGMGRPSMSESDTYGENRLWSLVQYDSLGMESKMFLPVPVSRESVMSEEEFLHSSSTFYSDDFAFISKEYDGLGRLSKQTMPGVNWQDRPQRYLYDLKNSFEYTYEIDENGEINNNGSLYLARINTFFNENNDKRSTVINQLGQKVQDISYEGTTPIRTYYVYDKKGQLSHVLQPMFENNTGDLEKYSFCYEYDSYGRISKKQLPGCDSICYWYDKGDRIVCMQDGLLRSNNLYRFYLYDQLGRLCIQGITPICYEQRQFNYLARTDMGPAFQSTGYAYFGNPSELPANICALELVNYYDDYAFLSKYPTLNLESVDGTVLGLDFKNKYLANAQYGHTQLTGVWQRSSNGEEMLTTFVYDEHGRLVKHSEIGLDKKTVVNEYSYNFVGDVTKQTISTLEYDNESLAYDKKLEAVIINKYDAPHTNLLTSSLLLLKDVNAGIIMTDTIRNLTYNDFGHIIGNDRSGTAGDMTYNYDSLHGWLTSIISRGGFEQHLCRESGASQQYYNGSISAMSWKDPQSGIWRRYDYHYDGLNRLDEAIYEEPSSASGLSSSSLANVITLIPSPAEQVSCNKYGEQIAYDANSNIVSLQRYGMLNDRTYGLIDDLSIEYNGNQRSSATDYAQSQLLYTGASDFVDKQIEDAEYEYNANGALIKDLNRGITNIEYDLLGNPTTITMKNRRSIRYVYSADGRRLRTVHSTPLLPDVAPFPLEGGSHGVSNTMSSTASTFGGFGPIGPIGPISPIDHVMGVDSTEYVDNFLFRNGHLHQYHFDGGYISFSADTIDGFHYYIQDYMGNNRMVVNSRTDSIEQVTHYYPYGGVIGDISTNESLQPYKFEGKELDRTFGLDNYDIEARQYFAMAPMWDRVDPLAEKYFGISPYAYCGGDPVNSIDFDGRDTYNVDSLGFISVIRDKNKNTLNGINQEGKTHSLAINTEQTEMLEGLLASQNNDGSSIGTENFGESMSIKQKDAKILFKALADDSAVEWQLSAYNSSEYKIATIHKNDYSPNISNLTSLRWTIHSHPDRDGTLGPSGETYPSLLISGDYNVAYSRYKIIQPNNRSEFPAHFVYHRFSQSVYKYDPWTSRAINLWFK